MEFCDSVRSDKSWPRDDMAVPMTKTNFQSVRFKQSKAPATDGFMMFLILSGISDVVVKVMEFGGNPHLKILSR